MRSTRRLMQAYMLLNNLYFKRNSEDAHHAIRTLLIMLTTTMFGQHLVHGVHGDMISCQNNINFWIFRRVARSLNFF